MTLKPYPKYKPSGVEWLGEVPEHWEMKKTKSIFRLITDSAPADNNYELLSIYTDIGVKPRKDLEEKGNKASTTDGYWKVEIGDLIVNKLLAWMGAIGYSAYEGVTSPAYDILRPSNDIYSMYYHYLFRTKIAQQEFKRWSRGIMEMRLRLYFDELGNLFMPVPSIDEQKQIIDFLDRETARIDTLITKQQRMIELLKEKRQAVISHAVTKGLDPTVKMKESGVEWLGEVPEHWETVAIKHIVSIPVTDGPHETPEFLDEGVPFISAEAISQGFINFDKKRGYISADLNVQYSKKYFPRKYDIFMIKSGATTGVTAIVETDDEFNIWSPLAVIRCNSVLAEPYFILNFMRSAEFKQAIELGWSFGTQQNIGMNVIENISVTLPPIDEQVKIANYLFNQTTKFDALIEKANQAIELLKERRTALISAAVTGKIDVREAA